MKNRFLVIPAVLLVIAIGLSLSGCTSGGQATGTPTPAVTPSPTPTPAPLYEFKPTAETWPFNVTEHTYFLYKRTNNLVDPEDSVRYQSWDYATLAIDNTTKVRRLVYNDTQEGQSSSMITQFYFELPSDRFINGSQWIVLDGHPGDKTALQESRVSGVDLRHGSDWYSARIEAGNETITVPAGTFECRKYVSKYQNATTGAIWVADFVPAPVKREMYGNNKTNVVYELLAYQMDDGIMRRE